MVQIVSKLDVFAVFDIQKNNVTSKTGTLHCGAVFEARESAALREGDFN